MRVRRRFELVVLILSGIAPFYLNGLYNGPLAETDHFWFWIVEIATWIVMPAALFLVGLRRELFTTTTLGITTKIRGCYRPWTFGILMVTMPILFWGVDIAVVNWSSSSVPVNWATSKFRYTDVILPPGPQTGWFRLFALAHLCLTAGIVAEFYHQAAINRSSRDRIAAVAYVLTPSIVFAGAHYSADVRVHTDEGKVAARKRKATASDPCDLRTDWKKVRRQRILGAVNFRE